MSHYIPSREDAYKLLTKYVEEESLINHGLMVEAAMGHFAKILGEEDIEKWKVIGLIHDLDFEKYPDEHCQVTERILKEENWPEDYIRAVMSHGWGIRTDVEPVHQMEKVIYTVDELTGLIHATAIMRPSKSLDDLPVKSVKKKWKDKGFARKINRDVIARGIEMLGMDRDLVIKETIEGLKSVATEIGLNTI